jgi:uncharacterized protein (TIGR00255 family)
MNSMTGYGRGEAAQDGFKITVEASSVNRKQADVTVHLPRELETLEPRIRDEVHQVVARGRLIVRVVLHAAENRVAGRLRLNTALARAYVEQYRRLAKQLGLTDPVTLDLLARSPGVLQSPDEVDDAARFWPAVRQALQAALNSLVQMRRREGAHLARDLRARMKLIVRSTARIQRQAPKAAQRYREQLRERIRAAGLTVPSVDDERLLKEVVYFAERSDISEELTRLRSHFQQFEDCLRSAEPVGRTLDFLSQEMHREINTIAAKSNDAVISREVVQLKAELERFREQVQNVE